MRIRFEQTTCSHIRVKDVNGEVLFVTDREELVQPIQSGDNFLLIGLKQIILNMDTALGVDFASVGTLAESREF